MALMAQTRQHLQPPNNDCNPASSAVVTCAQLHVLADQIRALRQVCHVASLKMLWISV